VNKDEIQTVFGTFIGNKIYASDGSIIDCMTYAITRKDIDDKTGFYNLKWSDSACVWIVFQYIITG
jgi:hypothetical protein